jgi:hypothetical protein
MQASAPRPTDALATRLQDIAARIVALEGEQPEATAEDGAPGDGRFRVELRALELRLEQAEAAAREGRDAVLAQLDRVASRIEWRLLQLEGDDTVLPDAGAAASGAQVVPIRSNDV